MELGDRKKAILRSIIDDYISTGEPVGSRTIAKKYEIGISSATIRNEMSDLEELGYLEQPHTSAGRIPSDKGYRLYVNNLMTVEYPNEEEISLMKEFLHLATVNELDKLIKRTTKLLSEITKYTSAVLTPSVKKSAIKSIQLIHVNSNDIVALVITDTGIIKNVIIKVPGGIDTNTLNKINNTLNNKLVGRTIEDIDLSLIYSIQTEIKGYSEILNSIIPALYESLNSNECDIYLEGTTNIFEYPEYSDLGKAKNFISVVENKDVLLDLFADDNKSLSISIGGENELHEVKNCSIIKASYQIGGRDIGKIGIIGPTRMNYSKVIGVMKYLSLTLNDIFNSSIEGDISTKRWDASDNKKI